MSVDALLEVVRQRGLRLANLFQLPLEHGGSWQANVTDGERHWEFGRADTPEAALRTALHIAATTEPEYYTPDPPSTWDSSRRAAPRPISKSGPISKL